MKKNALLLISLVFQSVFLVASSKNDLNHPRSVLGFIVDSNTRRNKQLKPANDAASGSKSASEVLRQGLAEDLHFPEGSSLRSPRLPLSAPGSEKRVHEAAQEKSTVPQAGILGVFCSCFGKRK